MEGQDTLKEFADGLRGKDGVEARTAVLQGHRVEFVRGKDLVRWLAARPDEAARFSRRPEQAKEVAELLLRRGLLSRCERLHRKLAPGAKKPVKFPKKLVPAAAADARTFVETSFYAWTYDRPTSPWMAVYAGLAVVGVLLACLFPLAPYWIKAAVFYLALTLLSVILLVLLTRLLLAAGSWVFTGRTLWLLPNVMQEGVGFWDLFTPLMEIEAPEEERGWVNSVLVRASVGVSMASFFYLLYAHSPETGSVVSEASRYRDEIFDMLNIRKDGLARLTATNATE